MAIHIYCSKCFTSNGLDSKKCSNCETVFSRDRKYRVSVSVKGKRAGRVVDNLTIAKEVEASIKSDLIREEFDITHHKAKKAPTLSDLWEKYLPWAKQNKATWKDDDYHYRAHIEPRFGNKPLDSITSFDLEKFKTELKKETSKNKRPFAPASIKHQLVLVRRLFNLAAKWGLYQGPNPVKNVKMPHVDNQVTEFLTEDEVERLLAVLDNWPWDDSAAFIKVALFSGIRRGEIFKLRWENIDFDRGMLTLMNPKGKKTTTIPICSEALEVLKGQPNTSPYCFPGKGGKRRVDFKGPWKKIRKAAELPEGFRFQGLRHHFASTLVSNGVDLAVVRELMTHKQMQTTLRYAHLRPDRVQQAAARAGELIRPNRKGKVIRMIEK